MGIRERLGQRDTPVQEQHEAFRKRAEERAEARARRRRRYLVPIGCVAATVGLIAVFLYSPLTAVGTIDVLGPISEDQRAQTKAQLSGLIGRQMIDLSPQEVNDLAKQQHWVEATSTTKHWPQTISIQVAVREPAVVVQSPTGEWTMDQAGYFIGPADQSHAHLVRVRIDQPVNQDTRVGGPGLIAAAQAVTVFPQTLKDYVTQWAVDGEKGLVVEMEPVGKGSLKSVQVIIGTAEEIPYKASTIEALLDEIAKSGRVSSKIDVRVPSRPVVIG